MAVLIYVFIYLFIIYLFIHFFLFLHITSFIQFIYYNELKKVPCFLFRHLKEREDLEKRHEKEMLSFRKKVEARRMRAQHRGPLHTQQRGKQSSASEATEARVNGYSGA